MAVKRITRKRLVKKVRKTQRGGKNPNNSLKTNSSKAFEEFQKKYLEAEKNKHNPTTTYPQSSDSQYNELIVELNNLIKNGRDYERDLLDQIKSGTEYKYVGETNDGNNKQIKKFSKDNIEELKNILNEFTELKISHDSLIEELRNKQLSNSTSQKTGFRFMMTKKIFKSKNNIAIKNLQRKVNEKIAFFENLQYIVPEEYKSVKQ